MTSPFSFHGGTGPGGATGVLNPPRHRASPARKRHADPPLPPSIRGGAGGGGGGGGGGGEGHRGAGFEDDGLGRLALALALVGITTLFLVLIAVWFFLRRPSPDWAAPEQSLDTLWISSALLAASSLAIEVAARRRRRAGERRPGGRWLALAWLLGVGFLLAQVGLWWALWRSGTLPSSSGYAAVFFSLTGLHALHVLGGLIFFAALGVQLARRALPVPGEPPQPSLRLAAIYWHFMGGIWLVLFTLLYFVR